MTYLIRKVAPASLCMLLVLQLAACASPAPAAPPVLEASSLALDMLPQAPDFARGRWWQSLPDSALDALLAQALASHPKLTLAGARAAAARARVAIAASGNGPFIAGSASLNRQRYSVDALVPPPIAGSWQNLSQLGLSLDYRFDIWGKVRERVAAAAGEQAAAELEQDSARQWLEAEVVTQYLLWQTARQQGLLQRQTLALAERLSVQSLTLKRAGLVSRDMPSEQDARLAEARIALAETEVMTRRAGAALSALTLASMSTLDALPVRALPSWPINTAGLHLNQLAQRPELAAARFQLESAAAQVRAARADFYPDISLSALIGLASLDSRTLFDAGSRGLSLTPAISLPLFQAGALQGALDLQQANYATAVALYNQTLLDIARESASALAQQQGALRVEAEARAGERIARQLAVTAQLRQQAGLAAVSEPLQAGQSHLNARLSLLQAHSQRLIAQAALVRAMASVQPGKKIDE